jgi:flavin-dependent dehydrogenase
MAKPMIVSAATSRRELVAGDGWISVGDAAQSLDPLSSLGLFKALDSARRACECILGELNGRATEPYQQWSDAIFSYYLKNRSRFYQSERRWPGSVFWQRRATM